MKIIQQNKIYFEDFKNTFKRIPDNSLDLIITDPPYPAEFEYIYPILSKEVSRTLKPNCSFVTLCGHYQVPLVINEMSKELRFWWIGALSGNRSNRIFGKNVITKFKPILWFLKGKRQKTKYVPIDHIHVNPENWSKEFHKWQQPVEYFEMYIKNLTEPGSLIYDPFIGSGTAAIVCKLNNRNFIGSENNKEYVLKSIKRMRGIDEHTDDTGGTAATDCRDSSTQ